MPTHLDFAQTLLHWFDQHGRHHLPWQHPRTPYRVWLSEIMLQQTQVAVVVDYFNRFTAQLPDLPALAAAHQDTVLALWSGLGYYSRARNLHKTAQLCMQQHHGQLPRDLDALMALPGIGRSTAGAILAQAWGDAVPILDGNVKRLLCRLHGIEGYSGSSAVEKQLWALAQQALPTQRLADYTQAQMDFGATLCTRQRPACTICPLQSACLAFAQGKTASIPSPKPSKALPQRQAWVVLLKNRQNHVLLQKRPAQGIWAALWSLPQFASHAEATHWLQHHASTASMQPLTPISHCFSHFRLHIQPLLARTDRTTLADSGAGHDWFDYRHLNQLGIPAPIRQLLESQQ